MGDSVVSDKGSSDRFRWLILAVVWLAGFIQPMNMVKIFALAPVLMDSFQISEDMMSIVMSLFYVIGIVLAFPAASVVNKIGIKVTAVIALVFSILGGIVGALSTDLTVFMISRVLEGVGMGVMGVVGVAAISPWFKPSKRGFPLAIWGTWVTIAFLIGPALFSFIYDTTGSWQIIWWGLVVFSVIVLVLFIFVYREPTFIFDTSENIVEVNEVVRETLPKPEVMLALKSPVMWIIGFMILVVAAASMAMQSFFPTYVYSLPDVSLSLAGIVVSSAALVGAVCALLAGKISDRIRSRKIILLIGFIAAIVYSAILFQVTEILLFIPILILIGIGENFTMAMIYASTAELMPNEKIAGASALLAFMQNIGMLVGTTAIGFVFVAVGDWGLAALLVPVPLYAIGLILTIVAWKKLP